MLIGRLIKYTGVAAVSGTIGFLIGGGRLPDSLRDTPCEITAKARDAADELRQSESTVTGALDYLRDRVADGARRVAGFLDD